MSRNEVRGKALVRVTARAASTSVAKATAFAAEGYLCAYTGGTAISGIRSVLGVLPGRDPISREELASFTVEVTVRSTPLL